MKVCEMDYTVCEKWLIILFVLPGIHKANFSSRQKLKIKMNQERHLGWEPSLPLPLRIRDLCRQLEVWDAWYQDTRTHAHTYTHMHTHTTDCQAPLQAFYILLFNFHNLWCSDSHLGVEKIKTCSAKQLEGLGLKLRSHSKAQVHLH